MASDGAVTDVLPFLWNVTKHVGWGRANNLTDVMLVQFFLAQYARDPTNDFRPTNEILVPDGIFGPITHSWIKAFQKTNWGCYPDGKVDHVDGSHEYMSNHDRRYTIIALNLAYWNSYRHFVGDIRMDPKCPNVLANVLTPVIYQPDFEVY